MKTNLSDLIHTLRCLINIPPAYYFFIFECLLACMFVCFFVHQKVASDRMYSQNKPYVLVNSFVFLLNSKIETTRKAIMKG